MTGHVTYNHPNIPVDLMHESCALDVAERGSEETPKSSHAETTLEDIAKHIGVTRERVRQIEAKATSKLRVLQDDPDIQDLVRHIFRF